MRYRSLSIGRGASNHLQLDAYGHCNNVSAKHAVIFYDEVNYRIYLNLKHLRLFSVCFY